MSHLYFFNDKTMIPHKQWSYFNYTEDDDGEDLSPNQMKLKKKGYRQQMYDTCFQYFENKHIACIENFPLIYPSDSFKMLLDAIFVQEYLVAFYYVIVTMCTVGYGDIKPTNDLELLIGTFSIIFACGVFAFAINKIGLVLTQIQNESKKKNIFLQGINNYMKKKNISQNLQYCIREYIQFYFTESIEDDHKIEQQILEILSDSLKKSLLLESYKIALKDSKIFCSNFSQNVLQRTIELIKEEKYVPEQTIFLEGDEGRDMYFVQGGELEVILCQIEEKKLKHIQVVKTLSRGACFGEREFFTSEKRKFSIRSKDFSTLIRISQKDFLSVLKEYPQDYEMFCLIKDQIKLYQNMTSLGSKCLSCNSQYHSYHKCPYISYVVNKDKLIYQHNYSPAQHRFDLKKRKYSVPVLNKLQTLKNTKIQDLNKEYLQRRSYREVNSVRAQFPYIINNKKFDIVRSCVKILQENREFLETQAWYLEIDELDQLYDRYDEYWGYDEDDDEDGQVSVDSDLAQHFFTENDGDNTYNLELPSSQFGAGGTRKLSKVLEEEGDTWQQSATIYGPNKYSNAKNANNSIINNINNNTHSLSYHQMNSTNNNNNYAQNNSNSNMHISSSNPGGKNINRYNSQQTNQQFQTQQIINSQMQIPVVSQILNSQQLQVQKNAQIYTSQDAGVSIVVNQFNGDDLKEKMHNLTLNLGVSNRTDRSNSRSIGRISQDMTPNGRQKMNKLKQSTIQNKMVEFHIKKKRNKTIKYTRQPFHRNTKRGDSYSNFKRDSMFSPVGNNDFIQFERNKMRNRTVLSQNNTHTFIAGPRRFSSFSQAMFGARRMSSLSYYNNNNNNNNNEDIFAQQELQKQLQKEVFEIIKEYNFYFPYNNLTRVLYENQKIRQKLIQEKNISLQQDRSGKFSPTSIIKKKFKKQQFQSLSSLSQMIIPLKQINNDGNNQISQKRAQQNELQSKIPRYSSFSHSYQMKPNVVNKQKSFGKSTSKDSLDVTNVRKNFQSQRSKKSFM